MLTNNLKKIMFACATPASTDARVQYTNGEYGSENIGYSASKNIFPTSSNYPTIFNTNYSTPSMAFGNGTTRATENDYKLENMLDMSLFTRVSGNLVNGGNDGKCVLTLTATYTGNTDAIISEIGYFIFLRNANSQTMLAREVLETPITVSNGDTFTVTMVIG